MSINNEVNITLKVKDKASKGFKQVEKSAGGLGSRLKKLGGPLKAVGIGMAAAGVAAGAAGIKLFGMADDIEQTIGKSKIVFGQYFDDMDKIATTTAKAMGLSRNEYLKAASGMQDLLIPMGFTREQATGMTTDMIGLSGALAEWSNGQYNAAQAGEIVAKAMLGETEQLKAMGIKIDQSTKQFNARIQAMMIDKGITLEQAKALDIQKQIFEKSTDAQKAYADGADSLTRKKAEMSATLKNLQETIATALIPAFHEVVTSIQPIIEKVAESIKLWFQNKENVEKLTGVIKTIIGVFGVLFEVIGKVIWFLTKMGEMLGFVAFKVVEFVASTNDKIISLGETIVGVWEGIKEGTISAFTAVGEFIDGIIDGIVGKFTAAWDKIKAIIDKIKAIGGSITGAVSSAASSAASFVTGTKANGGDVSAGSSYLVGERGSEVFVPKTDGTIVPNGGGGGNIEINMGGVTVTNEADENRLVEKIKASLTDDLQMYKFGVS